MNSAKSKSKMEDYVPMNTSFQKKALHNAVNTIIAKISDKKKKKSVELIIKNDIRKLTGSKRWDNYGYHDHDEVFQMLRNGYHYYILSATGSVESTEESIKTEHTDNVTEELISYEVAKMNHPEWMMPKQIAFSLGISLQKCSSKINKLNIKSNERLSVPYYMDVKISGTVKRKLCWLYNPIIIRMMDDDD